MYSDYSALFCLNISWKNTFELAERYWLHILWINENWEHFRSKWMALNFPKKNIFITTSIWTVICSSYMLILIIIYCNSSFKLYLNADKHYNNLFIFLVLNVRIYIFLIIFEKSQQFYYGVIAVVLIYIEKNSIDIHSLTRIAYLTSHF